MASYTNQIQFHFLVPRFYFPDRNLLKRFIVGQLKKEGKKPEAINYVFCDDAYLLEINRQYLDHNTYTDIITFDLSPKGHPLIADIYISIERVRDNAGKLAIPFKSELHRVIFHGVLHLCGYKDKTKAEAILMRTKEEEWLGKYAVSCETPKRKD